MKRLFLVDLRTPLEILPEMRRFDGGERDANSSHGRGREEED